MTEFVQSVSSPEEMKKQVEKMNAFGVRLTGSKAQNDFIGYLKNEIHGMGLETYSDPFYFNRWEEKESHLYLYEDTDVEEIHISSCFPYSGETDEAGITACLHMVEEKHLGFLPAQGKIAVVNINELDFLPSTLAFHIKNKYPETASIPAKYNGPVATSFVNFPFLQNAKAAGCKAVICIWRKLKDEMIEGQYLPFILGYQGIPCIWVNSTDGDKIERAARAGKTAMLQLKAEKEENAYTETFYTVMPGKNRSEAIIINTHTDGTNCIEENGPLAMLSMMKYFKDKELDRTLIFVFVTGHFRLPLFKAQAGGGVQATSKWLAAHPDLWGGKGGHIKALACVSVEHLGCKMFKMTENGYEQVDDVETELVYTGNSMMDKIYFDAIKGREKVNTISLRGHNFLHFGEGQPPFNCGIPEIALVTAPDCLTVISKNHEMDKFDEELMFEQTDTFIKIVSALLPMPETAIGKCDGYSLVAPNGQPVIYSKVKELFKKN